MTKALLLETLRNLPEDVLFGTEIGKIREHRNRMAIPLSANPLTPQAVFAVMRLLAIHGVKDIEWAPALTGEIELNVLLHKEAM